MHASVDLPVHPALRPYLRWVVGYRDDDPPPVHRGLPSPHLTFVVTVGAPLVVAAHPDPRQPAGRYPALLGGLHTRPALIGQSGPQAGVQLSLSPLGARALLGVPAGELASLDVAVTDVLGADGEELTDRLRAAPDWTGRSAAVQAVLLRRLGVGVGVGAGSGAGAGADAGPSPEVAEAWRLTTVGAGRLPVAEVARRVGWSRRHLAARFRTEIGLTPKEAARVVRFDRARRALAARVAGGRPADLAVLAAGGGFADQAHLTREWSAFSGLSPTAWLAAEFPSVQDALAGARQAARHDDS